MGHLRSRMPICASTGLDLTPIRPMTEHSHLRIFQLVLVISSKFTRRDFRPNPSRMSRFQRAHKTSVIFVSYQPQVGSASFHSSRSIAMTHSLKKLVMNLV